MSKYAVIGGTLWGNRGAEAMVVTTIGQIRDREPDAGFLLMSYQPKADRRLLNDARIEVVDASPLSTVIHFIFASLCWLPSKLRVRVPDRWLPGTVSQLRACRALFDVSGISFHDGRLGVVAYNALCVWPAMLLGVPVVRLSQASGPFRQPLNRWAARVTIKRAFHSFARGSKTAAYLEEMGLPEGAWSVAMDVAFSYEDRFSLTSENLDKVRRAVGLLDQWAEAGAQVIGLVPSSLLMKKSTEGDSAYVSVLLRVIRHLVDRGARVVVLPNATSEGVDTLRNNDLAVIARIRAGLDDLTDASDPRVEFVEFDLNTSSIRELVDRCDAIVTSRFHAMVAALALSKPTMVMGWSHKYEEVLEAFGCPEWAVDHSVDTEEFLSRVDRFLESRETLATIIGESLPGVIASSRSQFTILDRLPQGGRG